MVELTGKHRARFMLGMSAIFCFCAMYMNSSVLTPLRNGQSSFLLALLGINVPKNAEEGSVAFDKDAEAKPAVVSKAVSLTCAQRLCHVFRV